MSSCPEDIEENLLKRESFIAVFLNNIPLFMQFDLTTVLGLFKNVFYGICHFP